MGRAQDRRKGKLLRRHKQRKGGHPEKVAEMRRRMDPQDPQTIKERAVEYEARELARAVRKEAVANPAEGVLVGPLAVAARHAAPVICEQWGLDEPADREAVANWLTEQLGGVIDGACLSDYRDWRTACVVRVGGSSSS